MSVQTHLLEYEGCNFLRQRIILATLSGRPIKITKIRNMDINPGLRDYEINLLKLIDIITNGTKIVIYDTGTTLSYQPGLLKGGTLEFDCGLERGIGYFLELLLILAPFCETSINATLTGVTNTQQDLSPDLIKFCWLPVVKKFLLADSDELDIKVIKRGLLPDGGGEVKFLCPICRTCLKPVQLMKQGKITKIRGVAFACRVSPTLANRLAESIKKSLKIFTSNVYIHIDSRKGPASGNSPGFGAVLSAETTDGVFFGAEGVSNPVHTEPVTPEDLGQSIAKKLIEEIYRGGCVDSTAQGLTSLYMVLGQKDVSKLISGNLSIYSIYFLRHIKDFFQTTFKIESHVIRDPGNDVTDEETNENLLKLGSRNKVLLTSVGVGFSNINKMLL